MKIYRKNFTLKDGNNNTIDTYIQFPVFSPAEAQLLYSAAYEVGQTDRYTYSGTYYYPYFLSSGVDRPTALTTYLKEVILKYMKVPYAIMDSANSSRFDQVSEVFPYEQASTDISAFVLAAPYASGTTKRFYIGDTQLTADILNRSHKPPLRLVNCPIVSRGFMNNGASDDNAAAYVDYVWGVEDNGNLVVYMSHTGGYIWNSSYYSTTGRWHAFESQLSTAKPLDGNKVEIPFLESGASEVFTDPYEDGGGESLPGGGTGTFSETGDTVGIPGLPTLSAVDTGFITLFNPSAAQVKSLAAYMWSSSFDLTTFKNIVANPIDCILGLTIVPVNPPNAGNKTVTVGNIPTNITLPYLSSQFVEVDCGTLNVQEFWGSYLDYSPYTKMSLYLPYIGIIPLDIDDVMNASIAIKYHVDVLSGACVAYVLCNGTQLYTYVGQCSSNVPITSNDFTNTVNGILGIAGSIGKLAADGGASAPTEAAGIAANAVNALKPNIQKSGAMSGTGGLMGVQTPYLICQRPRQSVPHNQNTFTGYPANITAMLSDLSGYTEIDNIHLDGLSATQEEQQEIMDLLTSGVII